MSAVSKYIAMAFVGLVAIILAAMFLIFRSELHDDQFATRAEVDAADYFRRGWVPMWLPDSARDIRVRHRVDDEARLIFFAFDEKDRIRIESRCSPERSSEITRPPETLVSGASWWPSDLTVSGSEERYAFFGCTDEIEYSDGHTSLFSGSLATDREKPQAYVWFE